MSKRFEFVPEDTIVVNGVTVTRIRALVDIPYHGVKIGDLGGYIEREENLQGNAWVAGNAKVFGNAQVYGNAKVSGNAWVFSNAKVFDYAQIVGNAVVGVNTHVFGNAWVS